MQPCKCWNKEDKLSETLLLCLGLRITPFIYYVEVVALLIELEKSYDTMPNFTAADCEYCVFNLFTSFWFTYNMCAMLVGLDSSFVPITAIGYYGSLKME